MPKVTLDTKSGKIVDYTYSYQENVSKKNGAEVSTDSFLSGDNNVVSAVLYGSVDAFNPPPLIGSDLILVHPSWRTFLYRASKYFSITCESVIPSCSAIDRNRWWACGDTVIETGLRDLFTRSRLRLR